MPDCPPVMDVVRAKHKRPNHHRHKNMAAALAALKEKRQKLLEESGAVAFDVICPLCGKTGTLTGNAGRYRCPHRCGTQLTDASWRNHEVK